MFLFSGVTISPTPNRLISELVKLINPQKDQEVIDLGSGDGRILFAMPADRNLKLIGYEKMLIKHLLASVVKRGKKREDVKLIKKNLFKADIKSADTVFCSLSPRYMKKLSRKFKSELKDGARVISEACPIPNKQADKAVMVGPKFFKRKYYIYTFKKEKL